ncbi:MAG: ribosome biogenesis GTP-binding protein YihA/YsxC [Betaproteobacteria bacterium]
MNHAAATFAGSAASPSSFPRDGLPEVAFLGRSNVGKSSLLNALAGTRGLALVSSAPGRTRVVNFFKLSGVPKPGGAGRGELYLVDLPGYGYAKAPRQVREGFERLAVSYLAGREPLRLCVFILDARHEPGEHDLQLREWLRHHGLRYVVAANKIDALERGEARRREQALARGIGCGAEAVVGVSAELGTGTRELWNLVRGAAFAPRAAATDGGPGRERRPTHDGRTVENHGR